jgi:DNA-binding transcriptional regulator YiaG
MTNAEVGALLVRARGALRQAEAARGLGVTRNRLCQWERGTKTIPGPWLLKVLAFYGHHVNIPLDKSTLKVYTGGGGKNSGAEQQ